VSQVQHRGLREAAAVDLATIDWLVRAVRWLAPDIDYRWLVEESRENLPLGGVGWWGVCDGKEGGGQGSKWGAGA
jgi:hypothetical protein